jgi:hypothetical protein
MWKKMLYCIELSVPVWVLPIITKLSLVGMKLPEKYKEKFHITSEGPSRREIAFASGNCLRLRSKRRISLCIFQIFASLPMKVCFYCTGQVFPKDFLLTFNTVSSSWKTWVFCFEQVNFIASLDAKTQQELQVLSPWYLRVKYIGF